MQILSEIKNILLLEKTYAMRLPPVKQSLLILIAVLVAILGIIPRALALFEVTNMINATYVPVTFEDVAIRFSFTIIYGWIILQFNVNIKERYKHLQIVLRTFITFCINLGIMVATVILLIKVYGYILEIEVPPMQKDRFYYSYFAIFLIVYFISGILRYQRLNQQQIIENEELKRQNLVNELSALRNQINPHFLFNSLNSLNSLIRDNKSATQFVNKLSFMYRYILQSSDREVVSLREELKFLESYIFLIKTRYRNRFDIHIDINEIYWECEVPALSLQLLLENAVKHNEISDANPLLVKVYDKNGYICVENKIKLRKTLVDSTGKGLSNLNKRYLLLKDREINISDTNGVFKVQFLVAEKTELS
ncbi:sensor histidine kinase [Urechidicola sp. KH5]